MTEQTSTVLDDLPEDERKEKYRRLEGALGLFVRIVATALPIYVILYILDVFRDSDILMFAGAHNAIFIAVVLMLIFLKVPAGPKALRDRIPWYDMLLVIASLAVTLYMGLNYEALILFGGAWATPMQQAFGVIAIVCLSEAVRRTIGWPMVIITLAFFLYSNFAYLLPGIFNSPPFSFSRIIAYTYLSTEGIFGHTLEIGATIIVIFITFGCFLQAAGGGAFFFNLAFSLIGHVRGGPAKAAVVASALFGTMTGSPVANAGVTGSVTIPLMKKIGYKREFAGAVESVASTGGALMPPVMGAVAFLIADFTNTPYNEVALAALIPAILYFISLTLQVDLEAAREGLKGLPKEQLPKLGEVMKNGWHFLIPIAVLVVLLMVLRIDPLKSAIYSLGALFIVSYFRKETRLTLPKILRAFENSSYSTIDVAAITAIAGIITAAVSITGLGVNLSAFLIEASGGSLAILAILTGVTCYILGMGISSIAAYILLAVLVAPAMVSAGLPPLVAHFFVFYMGLTTFITPPHCSAVFVCAGIAGGKPFATAFQAMRLGIVCYIVPFIILFHPALMLVGNPMDILWATVTALVGVVSLSFGVEGYIGRNLKLLERGCWIAAGIVLMVPGVLSDMIGFAMIVLLGAYYWWNKQHIHSSNAPVQTNKSQ